jgi:hypothetical protein
MTFLDIKNTSEKIGKIPKVWKTSIIFPILKPRKPAENERAGIALTNVVCKIMETNDLSKTTELDN